MILYSFDGIAPCAAENECQHRPGTLASLFIISATLLPADLDAFIPLGHVRRQVCSAATALHSGSTVPKFNFHCWLLPVLRPHGSRNATILAIFPRFSGLSS